jgi:hypothetical protein
LITTLSSQVKKQEKDMDLPTLHYHAAAYLYCRGYAAVDIGRWFHSDGLRGKGIKKGNKKAEKTPVKISPL